MANHNLEKNVDSTTASAPSTPTPRSKPNVSAVNAFLQSVGHESIHVKGKRATLVDELRSYRLLASKFVCASDGDGATLRFWDTHANGLPLLSSFARRFLATPGTSVPSEVAFSVSSFVGRKERCRLTPENLAMTVFLKDKLA